jgi:hypothetical protein
MSPKTERIKDFIKKIDTKIAKLQKQRHTALRELADLEMAEEPIKKKKNRKHEWEQSVHSDYRSTCWECKNCGVEVWTKKDGYPDEAGPCE